MGAVLPERAPPEVMPGVTVADLLTLEDCDNALDDLTLAITQIERQLSTTPRNAPNLPHNWRANAEAALRIKRFLLPRVQERRGIVRRAAARDLARADKEQQIAHGQKRRRIYFALMWELEPDAMRRVDLIARERHPDLFSDGVEF